MSKSTVFTLIRKWGPPSVVLTTVFVMGIIYHREIVTWFGGDPDAFFGLHAFVNQSTPENGASTVPASQPTTALGASTQPATRPTDGIAYYTCSMHLSVKSKDPGTCPVCNMDLTPVTHEELQSETIIVDAQRRQLIGVKTTTVRQQNLVREIRAVGVVTYDETRLTDVSLKFQGWIGQMHADYTGKHVRAGEPLFSIYSPELLSAQQEYLDTLEQSRGNAARNDRLREAAKNRLLLLDLTRNQLEELVRRGKPLQYVPILSSATGTIISKTVVKGSSLEAGKTAYRIADLSSVWIEADLYESDIPFVTSGHNVDISLSYRPDWDAQGQVSYIYPYLNAKTRTGRIRIEVPNADGVLKPNMYARVHIKIPLGLKLAVPEEAILYAGPTNVVFLDRGKGRLQPRRIKVGMTTGDLVEVLEGLNAGDVVVTSGNFLIASESKLKSGIDKW